MKPTERDELLVRLDERTRNIWHILDEQEESINKKIDKIITHNTWQNGIIIRNTIWRRIIVGVGGTAIMALVLHLIGAY